MNLVSCRNSRLFLFLTVVTAVVGSCSVPFLGKNDNQDHLPPSNDYVAQIILERALEDCAIPDGKGMEVSCVIEEDGKNYELMNIVAQEHFLHRGFAVSNDSETVPEFRLRVDTLYVKLHTVRSKENGKRIVRSAETRITAVFRDNNIGMKVYKGRGVFQDDFASSLLDVAGTDEPYVIVSSFADKIKPLIYGVAITLFAWFLYSYRG